jgi:general secretion pathway protein C
MVAASIAFWALRLVVRAPGAPAHTVAAGDAQPQRADLTRLFGAPVVPRQAVAQMPAIASRFQLTGVMAPKVAGEQGVALIAVDGKMPRAFRVGSMIDGDLVLQSVSLRTASIGPARGRPAVVLEVPPLPVATAGTLPPVGATAPPAPGGVPPRVVPLPPVAPVNPAAVPAMPGGRVAAPQRGTGTSPRDQNQNRPPPTE